PQTSRKKASRSLRARRRPKAGTADVLGMAEERPIRAKWRAHYKRLTNLRDSLLRRQSDLNRDALEEQPNFSIHMADTRNCEYDRDFALGMLSSEQDALYQIEGALDRIRNGTYGICELTGKPIEPARLEAIPWTRFSLAAEARLEKDGVLRRARLGERESLAKVTAQETQRDEEEG